MKKTPLDYLVVGQGIAGSCVAIQLLFRGKKFMVVDTPTKNKCSAVAAGLFNPVTGQKLVKTWMADTLFSYLSVFYKKVERLSGKNFFYETPLYRPFATVEEQNEWMVRSIDEGYRSVIDTVQTGPAIDWIRDPLGGLFLKHCGYINTRVFLNTVRQMLIDIGSYCEMNFNSRDLHITDGVAECGELTASRIVFCEGAAIRDNVWFQNLMIRPLKGETIYIKSEFDRQVIVNRGVYMVPGNSPGEWRVGSTYDTRNASETITTEGRQELERKLTELVTFPFDVVSQEWGIRPTTSDRRPILGKHAEKEQFAVFNGLGTKGVSLAPYFSEVLVQWMENPAQVLNKDVDVTRFKSLY